MFLLPIIVLAAQFTGIFALPLEHRNKGSRSHNINKNITKIVTPENAEGDELELTGTFGKAVALGGGNIKTDVLFTKGKVGSLEVEFQDTNSNTLTVTENVTPAGLAPTGFSFLDSSSYKIALSEGAKNLTLQKVDFIFDTTLAALKDVDISKSKIGKFCADTNTFVISDAIGEQEFEDDENEVTLTVENMIAEWGIFIPSAAATAEGTTETKDETDVAGKFDTAIATPAGNKKTDILFTAGTAGSLEVEINATLANAVTVKVNRTPVAPPTGFLFVDPVTYQISTANKTAATDVVKVDFIFNAAVLAAADVKQGVIGKLDTATNQFIVDLAVLKAEFEFEEDENEWTLTVPDLNGEWAILISTAAALKNPTTLTL